VTSSSRPVSSSSQAVWRFEAFELDTRSGELRQEGVPVKLQPQPFKVLALLVERAGELVLRDDLKKALWGAETYVDFERGLNFCINQARAALGDSADSPRFIQTVPRRGYRFIAPVEAQSGVRVETEPVQTTQRASEEHPGWRLPLIGIAFLATLVAGATFIARLAKPPDVGERDAGRTMIAVLPLDDLTGAPTPSWFADGLTEELIAQLGRVSPERLGVIARTSVMAYRDSNKTIEDIGRELGVSHVLEGSIRRDDTRIRVTVQLISAEDQSQLWSETYDRTMHGALTLQSEVAAQVTRALALELLPGPFATATWAATRNPAAYEAYLRGKHFLTRGMPGDTRTAIGHLEDAIRIDPQFAAAYTELASAYHWLTMSGQAAARDAYPRAAAAAREALRLDPNLADAHAAVGLVQLWSEWDPVAAVASFTRAVGLNPSDAAAHHDLAWAYVALGRFDEAVSHITRARELDPLSPRASNDIGWLYLHIRQPSEAARACRQTLAIHPNSVEAQQCLERAHLQRGELTEALNAARAAAARSNEPVAAALTGDGTPRRRLDSLWRARLDRLVAVERERRVSHYTLAMHHAVLGESEEALDRLEQAYETRTSVMVLLPSDPLFDPLRTNTRFIHLVERIRASASGR
jgi:TolB-like protein/DNA-binding winged helix-turn-helix (wHTH) protein/Tfp pilus assembly protein PilF